MLRKLKNLYHFFQAILAVVLYRFPSKKLIVIGVTGTDGKTTTVHLIGHILNEAGLKTATVSTIGAYLGERKIKTGFHVTTPNSFVIQKLLRKIVNQDFSHVVLEATSQGLDQHRLLGCNFKIGVLTNITHDHLDYHKTFKQYLDSKSKLFNEVEIAVLNREDQSFDAISRKCQMDNKRIISYGLKNGDVNLETFPFKTKLLGDFNLYNCLAAISATQSLNVDDKNILKGISSFEALPGRMEEIIEGQNFKVFVDFAHTPAALEKTINTLKKQTKGRIIHVFGCTGNRDKTKRPIMGEISAKLSDKIILTHEDTYNEDLEKIILEIEIGVKKEGGVLNKTYWKILDREKAIYKAIEMAKENDIVLITGVGHQDSLNLGGKEVPWSEAQTVRKALKRINK